MIRLPEILPKTAFYELKRGGGRFRVVAVTTHENECWFAHQFEQGENDPSPLQRARRPLSATLSALKAAYARHSDRDHMVFMPYVYDLEVPATFYLVAWRIREPARREEARDAVRRIERKWWLTRDFNGQYEPDYEWPSELPLTRIHYYTVP